MVSVLTLAMGKRINHRVRAPLAVLQGLLLGLALLVPGAAAAQTGDTGWSLDPYGHIELGAVTGKSRTDDDEYTANGGGVVVRGRAGVELADSDTTFAIEADRIAVLRLSDTRPDTDRDRLTISVAQDFGRQVELELRLRRYDDLVGAEFGNIDATEVSAQATYEPEQAHRFRLQAGWNERQYDDGSGPGATGSHGRGPEIGAEYRHRLARYHYLSVAARAEFMDADNPERRYSRQSASVAYTLPLTPDLRVRPGVSMRHTRFGGRPIGTTVRKDTYIAPEMEVLWWPGDWRIEAEAKYIAAGSNDPVRDRAGYRFSLTVGHAF